VGIVESWEIMMGALERMRILDAKISSKSEEKQALEEWVGEEKPDWEINGMGISAGGGLGRGYSTLRRIGQVRTGEWGGKKRPSSLRKEEIF